jgi:hypothetical protein
MKFDLVGDELELAKAIAGDEEAQNQNGNPMFMMQMLAGADIDCISDDPSFGLTVENPVPVNGQLGELTYLSRLRTPNGDGFVFHRIGSEDTIDLYELLSFSGDIRFIAYLDMYHPRRSRKPIVGLSLEDEPTPFTGSPLRLDAFPMQLLVSYDEIPYPRQLAYANLQQLENLPIFIGDARAEPEPEPETGVFNSRMVSWRSIVTAAEIEQAHEPRGLIVPVFTDAEQIAPGVAYGWVPSKALAKRAKLNVDELYDPVAVVVLDAFDNYTDLVPDAGAEFGVYPKSILLDEEGYVTVFGVSGDLDIAQDYLDFATDYWFPKRIYYLESTWYQISGRYSDSGSDEVLLQFRWLSTMDRSSWQARAVQAKSTQPSVAIYSMTARGNLVQNKKRGDQICVVCGEPGIVFVSPEDAAKIDDWNWKKIDKLPSSLPASVRETLLTGTHEWCFVTLPH